MRTAVDCLVAYLRPVHVCEGPLLGPPMQHAIPGSVGCKYSHEAGHRKEGLSAHELPVDVDPRRASCRRSGDHRELGTAVRGPPRVDESVELGIVHSELDITASGYLQTPRQPAAILR
jgi:hypothetical protein